MLSATIVLSSEDQLDGFACGVDSLDDWLREGRTLIKSTGHPELML